MCIFKNTFEFVLIYLLQNRCKYNWAEWVQPEHFLCRVAESEVLLWQTAWWVTKLSRVQNPISTSQQHITVFPIKYSLSKWHHRHWNITTPCLSCFQTHVWSPVSTKHAKWHIKVTDSLMRVHHSFVVAYLSNCFVLVDTNWPLMSGQRPGLEVHSFAGVSSQVTTPKSSGLHIVTALSGIDLHWNKCQMCAPLCFHSSSLTACNFLTETFRRVSGWTLFSGRTQRRYC